MKEKDKAIEESIKDSEERYRNIIENTSFGISACDETGQCIATNKAMANMVGATVEQVLSQNFYKIESWKKSGMLDTAKEVLSSGEKKRKSFHILTTFGKDIWLDVTFVPYIERGREFLLFLAEDITERKKVGDELKFRSGITEQVNASVIATGLDFKINWVNQAFSALYGYSADEAIGQTPDFLNIDPFSEEIQNDIYQTVSSGEVWTGEAMNRRKDGTTFLCELDIFPLMDENGNIFAYAGHQRDITDRKKAEKELQASHDTLGMRVRERTYELESAVKLLEKEIDDHKSTEKSLRENEKRFRAVADSTADLLWEGDVINNSLNWFGDIDGMLGFAQGEFPRTIEGHMDHIHPEDKKNTIKAIERSLQTGDDFSAEYRIRCKDGTYRFWDERGSAIGFQDGKAVKWVGAVSDITERKETEKELLKAEKELRIRAEELTESNAALKVLLKQREQDQADFENNILSNIKHLIMPYIEKLKRNKLEQDELAYLNIIESNLNEIVSPFATKLSFQFLDFTPREIMIADLIKDGKQDKDIMEILHISIDTVKTHRKNIRKKLGIYGKRINLRTKLLTLTN